MGRCFIFLPRWKAQGRRKSETAFSPCFLDKQENDHQPQAFFFCSSEPLGSFPEVLKAYAICREGPRGGESPPPAHTSPWPHPRRGSRQCPPPPCPQNRRQPWGPAATVPTTQPVESTLRSETHLKLRVQPPLLREQSRTGPKEESKSLMVSK